MLVLIVEDDPLIAQTLEKGLKQHNIDCNVSDCAEDAANIADLYDFDLIISDLMLPDNKDLSIIKTLRKGRKKIPILILSALNSSEHKTNGLNLGADDYMGKPFRIKELIARVKAIVRRYNGHSESVIEIDDKLKINLDSKLVTMCNKPVHFTAKERTVLELLALRKGGMVTKMQLLDHLYKGGDEPGEKIVDVFICRIRKKLFDASGGSKYIETYWNVGYALKHPSQITDTPPSIVNNNYVEQDNTEFNEYRIPANLPKSKLS